MDTFAKVGFPWCCCSSSPLAMLSPEINKNGRFLSEPDTPVIIYSVTRGTILWKNESRLMFVSENSEGPMAFDPVRREIFWIGETTCDVPYLNGSCLVRSLTVYRHNFAKYASYNTTPMSKTLLLQEGQRRDPYSIWDATIPFVSCRLVTGQSIPSCIP